MQVPVVLGSRMPVEETDDSSPMHLKKMVFAFFQISLENNNFRYMPTFDSPAIDLQ